MALYAIGDLHLCLSAPKPMDIFGGAWVGYMDKLKQGLSVIGPEDTTVLLGDLSWALDLDSAKADFAWINDIPGKKIILKGNHDYWWSTASKAHRFFDENGIKSIDILHNNFFEYGEYALCGTRGWFYEEEKGVEHDRKIMRRELMRLEASLEAAGERKKLVFLHYPPIFLKYRCDEILELLKKYEVRLCCYGHIHGKGCAASFNGWRDGTEFRLVSADYLDFTPIKLPY